ncbi:MBL fold metallo-hydrolase [Roseovarius sp. S1116L3]|uniref:MBL fold metallo-hydrolase n=1 Tax=Roseovarius roseus TaxID=3342636 RepID=UPI0037280EFA
MPCPCPDGAVPPLSDIPSFDPPPGRPERLAPAIPGQDLRRILAPNPSPMTFRGTNTYLLGTKGIAVIDPGPDDDLHLSAILSALGPEQHVSHILVTHAHRDHSPLARRIAAETGAPVLAYGDAGAGRSPVMAQLAADGMIGGGEGVDLEFAPDILLKDREVLRGDGWQICALWTPGHFGNHMCFAAGDAIFTGDLVMGWASSLVSPPDGDAAHFVASCARLKALGAAVLHPGHGAPVQDPSGRLNWLIHHRAAREAAIIAALAHGPATAEALAERIYTDTPAALMRAATRNVLAHLIDLTARGEAVAQGPLHADAVFALPQGYGRG